MKFLLALAFLAIAQAVPWVPEPRQDQWWQDRHNAYLENTKNNRDNIHVVFYGDSITEGWGGAGRQVFDERYAPLGTANYGIGGDRTEHLIWRIENGEVEGLNPKVVVLKIGTNNGGDSTDDVVRGVKAVSDLLLQKLPNTKLLLLGVLPRNDVGWFRRVADINIKISKFHDGNRVHYLDMFEHFATAWGVVDSRLFNGDKLHLEAPGYLEWANTMDYLFNHLLQS